MSKEGDGAQEAYGREREVETLRAPGPTGTIETPVEHLDLATAIKVSQAMSGEIVQEKQLEILMRTAIEQAGAERGVLVLSRWTEPRIAAQATTGDGGIVVKLHDEAMTPAVLPESVIQYVVRTNESVILDDAAAQNPFSADPYIRQQHARSILCLPFLNQGQLIGVLYLENNLTPGVFAPARIAVLKLLASQAAISLENARLYRDLAEREAKFRRLVEAQTPQAEDELRAIIDNAPVFLWSDLPDGYCDFLNQRWLTYFNLSLQEAQGAGWATLLHPDDAAHHLESWQKSVSTGIPFGTEARFRSADGEYRWFLTRANPLRDKTGRIVKWYGTNIDIENLKREGYGKAKPIWPKHRG
jgi:PAS domain S-box-containing protein